LQQQPLQNEDQSDETRDECKQSAQNKPRHWWVVVQVHLFHQQEWGGFQFIIHKSKLL
jgi:hypothetical protein